MLTQRDKDRLGFKEFLKSKLTPLSAVTRLLVPTKRRVEVCSTAIHMDVAAANLGSHCERVVHIARLDITRQAVRRVVSNLDRLVFVLIRKNREYRAEDFLARDGHVVIHVTEDGGLDVVASVQAIGTPCAAADQFSAFINALLIKP